MKKIFVLSLMMVFVSLAFASAVILPPIATIGASPNPTNLTSTITAIGIDLSGSGINYVRIYEDGIKVKECSSSTCVFVAAHTAPGTRSYYATTADNTGRTGTSDTINVIFQNSAPILNPIGTQTVNENSALVFTISGYDYNDDSLTYSASGSPLSAGAVFSPLSMSFIWTPTFAQSGSYFVTFSVSDGSLSDSEIVQINVIDVPVLDNTAPQWSNIVVEASDLAYSPLGTYEFNSTWTDNVALDSVWINFDGVNYSASGVGGVYSFSRIGLAAGTHDYEWFANDTNGNSNSTGALDYIVDKATPALSISILPSNSVTNGTQTNVTGLGCLSELMCTLYRNGIAIVGSNSNVETLPIGTYIYVYNTTGNENYTGGSASATLNVVASGDEGDGGTNGGGGSDIKTINSDDLARGYSVSLDLNDKLKFIFCGSPYYIKLTDVNDDDEKAAFMLTPLNKGFTLKEGVSERIDLDSDSVDDILFRLESVGTDSAKVYIKKISNLCVGAKTSTANLTSENVEKLEPREEESSLVPAGFLIFGIVLSALGVILKRMGAF